MFKKSFDPQRVGKPIAARTINAPADEIARLGNLRVEPPLEMIDGPGGPMIRLAEPVAMWIKLTANSGANYAWTDQVRTDAGWVAGFLSGTTSTDPAIEINGNAAVPVNTIGRAWRDVTSASVLFMASSC
jgi:hypothetical protein